jgi:hypothetical protein
LVSWFKICRKVTTFFYNAVREIVEIFTHSLKKFGAQVDNLRKIINFAVQIIVNPTLNSRLNQPYAKTIRDGCISSNGRRRVNWSYGTSHREPASGCVGCARHCP